MARQTPPPTPFRPRPDYFSFQNYSEIYEDPLIDTRMAQYEGLVSTPSYAGGRISSRATVKGRQEGFKNRSHRDEEGRRDGQWPPPSCAQAAVGDMS